MRDSSVVEYLQALHRITRDSVFTTERFSTILKMNFGGYDHLLRQYTDSPELEKTYADICKPIAAGILWNAEGTTEIRPSGLLVRSDTTFHAQRIEVSVDHNDNYGITFYSDSIKVGRSLMPRRSYHLGGMRIDTVEIPELAYLAGYNRMRIYPERGDDMYSIGHLRVLPDSL